MVMVTFTEREPQVGKSLAAVLEDKDAGVTNVEWQWYRLTDNTTITDVASLPAAATVCTAADVDSPVLTNCVLDGATSASYTPVALDFHADGRYLAARATYNDKHNEGADNEGSVLRVYGNHR